MVHIKKSLKKISRITTNSASLPKMIINSDTLLHIAYQLRLPYGIPSLETRHLSNVSTGYGEVLSKYSLRDPSLKK